MEHENIDGNMVSFLRKTPDKEDFIIVVFNFSGADKENYPLGVDFEGEYEVILDSNFRDFGGSSSSKKRKYKTKEGEWNYRKTHIELNIAANSTMFLKLKK